MVGCWHGYVDVEMQFTVEDIPSYLSTIPEVEQLISTYTHTIRSLLCNAHDVVLYTPRELSSTVSIHHLAAVSHIATEIVRHIHRPMEIKLALSRYLQCGKVPYHLMSSLPVTLEPRFIIAKGGITAHDIAAKGLGIKQGKVLGQILPGVPVWRAEIGVDSPTECTYVGKDTSSSLMSVPGS